MMADSPRSHFGEGLGRQMEHIARTTPKSKFPDPCEWDPVNNTDGVVGQEHAPAEVIVGVGKGNWRLCLECSKLSRFDRYTKRQLISNGGQLPWLK